MALAAQQWPQIGQGEVARPVWEIVSLPESLGAWSPLARVQGNRNFRF